MANYATNIFHASTENKQDLDKIEAFLDDNFNGFVNRYSDIVDAEFSSRWEYPEKEIDELVASLEAKDKIYIRILTYELEDEYVSFRIFSQGKWDINLKTHSLCTNTKKTAILSVCPVHCSIHTKVTRKVQSWATMVTP